MGIESGWQGKAAERRKAALTKEQLRSRYNIVPEGTQGGTPAVPRAGLIPSLENIAHVRERDRSTFKVVPPSERQDYFVPEYPNFKMDKKSYDRAMHMRAERIRAEQKMRDDAVKAKQQEEWARKDAEVRARREAWQRESDAEMLAEERAKQAERIERTLLTTAITDALDGATSEEATAVVRRIKQQGLERLPSMYRYELDRLRSGKK